jgi:hypothetical protein
VLILHLRAAPHRLEIFLVGDRVRGGGRSLGDLPMTSNLHRNLAELARTGFVYGVTLRGSARGEIETFTLNEWLALGEAQGFYLPKLSMGDALKCSDRLKAQRLCVC